MEFKCYKGSRFSLNIILFTFHAIRYTTHIYGTPLLSYYAANALYGVVISIFLVVKSIYCVVISISDMVISIYDVVM